LLFEKVPEKDHTEAPNDKKKNKKENKDDLEDMYSFDLSELEKTKPVKKKKEDASSSQVTQKDLERAMKAMAKIVAKEDAQEAPMEEAKAVAAKDQVLLRFPSPSRTRQESPLKRDKSPAKMSAPLKASASEFVPHEFCSPHKEFALPLVTSAASVTSMQAQAVEFICPPATSSSSLQASAVEFVPPGFDPTVAKPACDVPTSIPVVPLTSEPYSESCWAHAVFTPSASLESSVPQPAEMAQTAPVPMQSPVKSMEQTLLENTRLDVGNILGKVKQSLTSSITRLAPGGAGVAGTDPSLGKVLEKVKKIEEKEADNEAEKEREAAIKAVHAEQTAQQKENQREMDETLMDCFLQAVTTRIKDRDLPIMGTTLYGKHMRSSRYIGTSCDVKDSSFVWLRPFLESLEDEKLLELKPEVKDPTVIWINRSHPLICKWHPWAFHDTVASQKSGGRRF